MTMEKIKAASLNQSEQDYRGAIELFEMRCRAANLSPRTIEWYKTILEDFTAFLSGQDGNPKPRHTKPVHVRAYLDYLHARITKTGRRVAPGTVKRSYVALGTFFRFLNEERVVLANPMAQIATPRAPRVVIRSLSSEQIGQLLSQFNVKDFTGLRNWTMTLLLLDSGMRLSEILGVKVQDVSFQAGSINVLGKGAKERLVLFGALAKKALWDYRERRGDIPGQDFLFVDHFGRPVKKRWYQQILARAGKAAGIEGVRVSPHTLRHTFAVQYVLNGGDAFSLQRLLGHSSLETVRLYLNLANRDVSDQFRKASPMDRLGPEIPGVRRKVTLK